MSCDQYIDQLIGEAYGDADKACIIGLDGSPKTSEEHPNALRLDEDERQKIASCFKARDFTSFMAKGVPIEGKEYIFLREVDGKTVYAKKQDSGAVTLQATQTAVVIAHCPEGGQQGNTNKGVAVIAEYLEIMGM